MRNSEKLQKMADLNPPPPPPGTSTVHAPPKSALKRPKAVLLCRQKRHHLLCMAAFVRDITCGQPLHPDPNSIDNAPCARGTTTCNCIGCSISAR